MFPQFSNIESSIRFQDSYVLSESSIVEKRQEAAESFKEEVKTGCYSYLQSQLCGTFPTTTTSLQIKSLHEENVQPKIFGTLNTPFGKATIEFKYCPKQYRYNRFVCRGGKYTNLLEKLDKKYKNHERKNIYQQILKYLTLPPVSNLNPWDYSGFTSNYQDNNLANLCAILAVCDPCFGKGESGGKDIRAILRSHKCINGCRFQKLLEPSFYPLSQRRAYQILRRSVETKYIKGAEGTLKGMNKMTQKHSPLKFKTKTRLISSPNKKIKFSELI